MAKFKKGDPVQQVVEAPISGQVLGYGVDQQTGDVTVLVGYEDTEGNKHARHFLESQLQPVEGLKPAV